jgi:hypothetical protein
MAGRDVNTRAAEILICEEFKKGVVKWPSPKIMDPLPPVLSRRGQML